MTAVSRKYVEKNSKQIFKNKNKSDISFRCKIADLFKVS